MPTPDAAAEREVVGANGYWGSEHECEVGSLRRWHPFTELEQRIYTAGEAAVTARIVALFSELQNYAGGGDWLKHDTLYWLAEKLGISAQLEAEQRRAAGEPA